MMQQSRERFSMPKVLVGYVVVIKGISPWYDTEFPWQCLHVSGHSFDFTRLLLAETNIHRNQHYGAHECFPNWCSRFQPDQGQHEESYKFSVIQCLVWALATWAWRMMCLSRFLYITHERIPQEDPYWKKEDGVACKRAGNEASRSPGSSRKKNDW